MAINRERGRYIVWEGSDGAGKSTQMKLALAESARRGIETLAVREPGYTQLGQELRGILLTPRSEEEEFDAETEALIYLADRSHLYRRIVAPALERGIDVHSDRNWWSSIAYQAAAGGVDVEKLIATTKLMMPERYIEPDIGLVLQLTTEERKRRKLAEAIRSGIGLDRIEQRHDDYFERVDQGYERYAIRRFGAYGINAFGPEQEVASRWWGLVFPAELDIAN